MAAKGRVLVGTAGQGVMASMDGGEQWSRISVGQGMHSDCIVRALVSDPGRPEAVYAGTDMGLYRSEDGGAHWERLENELSRLMVWALDIDRRDPKVMYAGTGTPHPAGIFRSEDGGKSWQALSVEIAESCPAVGVPRITGISIDPENSQRVWAGVEVDFARRSSDGGKTWSRPNGDLRNPDIHDVLVSGGTVYIVVNDDVWTSFDGGATFSNVNVREKTGWRYPRSIKASPADPKTVYLAIGDYTPGSDGAILRSKDAGRTWETLTMPVQPNSAMWAVGISPADPNQMYAGSRYGYLYATEDGGATWTKLKRELSEVSKILVVPA